MFNFNSTRYLAFLFSFYLAMAPVYVYAASATGYGGWFGGISNVTKNGASVAADYLIKIGNGAAQLKRSTASAAEIGSTALRRVFFPAALGAGALVLLIEGVGWVIDYGSKVVYETSGAYCGYPGSSAIQPGHWSNYCGNTVADVATVVAGKQLKEIFGSNASISVTSTKVITTRPDAVIEVKVYFTREGAAPSDINISVYPGSDQRRIIGPDELGQVIINNDVAIPEMMTPTATDTPSSAKRAYASAAESVGAETAEDDPPVERDPNCVRNTNAQPNVTPSSKTAAVPNSASSSATCSQVIDKPETKPDQCGFGYKYDTATSKCVSTADPNEVPKPLELPAACTWLKFFCDFFGDSATIDPDTSLNIPVPTTITAPNFNFGGGCPSPRNIHIHIGLVNTTIELSFQPFCELASLIRPIVIAVAGYQAALIVSGTRTNEGD